MQTVKQMISSFTRQRKQRRRAYAAFTTLAILVSITTMYTLSQPAATLAAEPTCGLEEHIHTDNCYTQRLVCGLEEQPGDEAHVHDETCYVQQQEQVCGQEEAEAHTHGEDCYGLTCGQDEYEAHTHGEDCYTTVTESCGQEEYPAHTHGDGCYTTTRSLICGQAESSGHSHGDGCYDEEGTLICGQSESEGHTHSDSCYEESTSLTCTAREGEGHTHTDSCTTQRTELTCAAQEGPGHTHSDSCTGLTCGLEETEGHTHTEDCYQTVDELACGKGHVHTDACYERVLICEKPEHAHSSLCYGEAEDVLLQNQGDMMIVLPEGAEVPEGYDAEYSYIAADNSFGVKVFAPEGALPEDAALVAELLEEESEAYTAAEAALQAMNEEQTEDENPGYDGFVALDIRFVDAGGDEVEPTAPVYVCINALGLLPEDADPATVAVQHHAEITESALFGLRKTTETVVETVADSTEETGPVEVSENAEDVTRDVAAAFPVESFSTFTITWQGDRYDTLKVSLIKEDGTPIGTDSTQNITEATDVKALAPEIDGYEFVKAVYCGRNDSLENGTEISQLQRVEKQFWWWKAQQWQYRPKNSDSWEDISGGTVYFVYKETIEQPVIVERGIQNHKFVEYNSTDDTYDTYDLNLTVSGALGSQESKAKVDVLLILDISGSMEYKMDKDEEAKAGNRRLDKVVTEAKKLIDTLDANKSVDAQYSIVTFSGPTDFDTDGKKENATVRQDWTGNAATAKGRLDNISPNGGTNYQAGIQVGKDQLNKSRSGSQTVVIFLTDGLPTVRNGAKACYETATDKVKTNNSAAVTELATMNASAFYAIGAGPTFASDTGLGKTNLDALSNQMKNNGADSEVYNVSSTTALEKAFEDIASKTTFFYCTDVHIFDTLNENVEMVLDGSGNPQSLTVTVKKTDGTVVAGPAASVTLPKTYNDDNSVRNESVTLTPVYSNGQITLNFPETYSLEPDYEYIVTAKIKTTDKALENYETDGYTDTGDSGTGITSADQAGLYCNVVDGINKGYVTYDFNDENDVKKAYPKPVVQLNIGDLTIEKEIYGLEAEDELNDLLNKIEFLLKSGDDTVKTIKPVLTGTGANAVMEPIINGDTVIGTKLTVMVRGITPGEYTVTETDYEKAGTKVWASAVNDKTSVTACSVEIKKGENSVATLVNCYVPGTGSLMLTKKVEYTGNGEYTTSQEFEFTVTGGLEANKEYNVTYTGNHSGTTTIETDASGVLTVKLYQGESVTIEGLPVGESVTITETDESRNGYAPSWSLTDPDTDADATINHGETAQATVNAETEAAEIAHIYFTNTTGAALPSTGGVGTQIFTLMGTMMMLGAGVLLMLQRRRREGADAD